MLSLLLLLVIYSVTHLDLNETSIKIMEFREQLKYLNVSLDVRICIVPEIFKSSSNLIINHVMNIKARLLFREKHDDVFSCDKSLLLTANSLHSTWYSRLLLNATEDADILRFVARNILLITDKEIFCLLVDRNFTMQSECRDSFFLAKSSTFQFLLKNKNKDEDKKIPCSAPGFHFVFVNANNYGFTTDKGRNLFQEKNRQLYDKNNSQRSHTSGPCQLWWPLNHTEFFILDRAYDPLVRFYILIYCRNMAANYSGVLTMGERRALLPKHTPQLNVKMNYGIVYMSQGFDNLTLHIEMFEETSAAQNPYLQGSILGVDIPFNTTSTFDILIHFKYGDDLSPTFSNAGAEIEQSFSSSLSYLSHIQFTSRENYGILLNLMGLINAGAEVGVQTAIYSDVMLSKWRGKAYLMIDPWKHYSYDENGISSEYVDLANVEQTVQDSFYEEAKEKVSKYGSRAVVMRMTSEEAAGLISDQSLDFVYIDAAHDYTAVMSDMVAWWPKVRVGGVLSGHDFYDLCVRHAVLEFARRHDLIFFRSYDEDYSWFIFKNSAYPRHG